MLEHTRDVAPGAAQLIAGLQRGLDARGDPPTARRRATSATTRSCWRRRTRRCPRSASSPGTTPPSRGPSACRSCSTTTRRAPASRSASTCLDAIADLPEIVAIKESSGDFSRFLHLRRRYDGRIDGHVRLGRPGRRLLLVGRPLAGWPAPPNVLPRQHVEIMDAAQRAATTRLAYRLFDGDRCRGCRTWRAAPTTRRRSSACCTRASHCGDVRQPLLPLDAATAADDLRRARRGARRSLPSAPRRLRCASRGRSPRVEVHAEGEQGTVLPRRRLRRARERRCARSSTTSTRSTTRCAASSASSRAGARRRARTSCSRRPTRRPTPGSSSCRPTARTR